MKGGVLMAKKSTKSTMGNNDMTMKLFVAVALVIAFVAGYIVSRAKYKPQIEQLSKMVIDKDAALQQIKSNSNKIMMKDDKMWVVENGEMKQMDSDIMMPSGDKVMMDGKVLRADGTDVMMKNGDAIDMGGKMMTGGSN